MISATAPAIGYHERSPDTLQLRSHTHLGARCGYKDYKAYSLRRASRTARDLFAIWCITYRFRLTSRSATRRPGADRSDSEVISSHRRLADGRGEEAGTGRLARVASTLAAQLVVDRLVLTAGAEGIAKKDRLGHATTVTELPLGLLSKQRIQTTQGST